jgi:hypothetical protein
MQRTIIAPLLCLALATCSSSEAPQGSTAGYKPCDPANRVGGFALQLVAAKPHDEPPTPAFAQAAGKVGDRIDPRDLWQVQSKEGDCSLVTLPNLFCDPRCSGDQVCAGQNKCVPEPVLQDVGAVTVTGLIAPLSVNAVNKNYYAPLPPNPYPPFAADAAIRLSAAGGSYGAFSLAGRGIEPLVFAQSGLNVMRDKPLALTWTASKISSTRVAIALDIAHHGGIAARILCDVPDTGSATIAGGLITKLIERGTAGFPTINLTRRTVDSTAITPGCVEFAVSSSVEELVQVEGVTSCREDLPCPGGRTCGADLKCR